MSLTEFELRLVQSAQNALVERTLAKELLAEEALKSGELFAGEDSTLLAVRIVALVRSLPGASARDIAKILGTEKLRNIERYLADFRESGLLGAWQKNREGQRAKPGSRYDKGGRIPWQHSMMGDLTSPIFQGLDAETRKSLSRAQRYWVQTPGFREYMVRGLIATSKIAEAGSAQLQEMMKKVPELRHVSVNPKLEQPATRLWLEEEAVEYVASRAVFAQPEDQKENLPFEERWRRPFHVE